MNLSYEIFFIKYVLFKKAMLNFQKIWKLKLLTKKTLYKYSKPIYTKNFIKTLA